MSLPAPRILGVDTGGTFTDFVLWHDGGLSIHKVLSTPAAPARAILQGLEEMGLLGPETLADLRVVHGSTVATNAVLEGKGVRTVFITNHGLRDMLSLGRQAREGLYDLQPEPRMPPVARELCLETGGRLAADGQVVEDLSDSDLTALSEQLKLLAPQAVAINLLFSYLDDRFERAIAAAVADDVFVSRSSAVLPEFREYERGMTTWLNAYVGPLVQNYVNELSTGLHGAPLSIMQSSGGTMAAQQASQDAVHMLLSGPAGGLAGARFTGRSAARHRLLTFDMGGTSTDVALVDGDLQLTTEGHIGPYPVAVPMVDMHTIGAGGGSIASVDAGGLLQVGPTSAGADPGPACYGRGGEQATVTDANLVLGRLLPDAFLGGRMQLDADAAHQAVARTAHRLGLDVREAAAGIVRVANEHMARALRVMSVQRGIDPRELTLVSFGGAGGLHVCALADALQMQRAMVPIHAGVLSALGMLAAPRVRHVSQTRIALLAALDTRLFNSEIEALAEQGRRTLLKEGVTAADIRVTPSVDLRYHGQSYFLNVSWDGHLDRTAQRFHDLHQSRYGHRLDLPVELVNLRVACRGPETVLPLSETGRDKLSDPRCRVAVFGESQAVPVYSRAQLGVGQRIVGPALLTETVSTTWLAAGWVAQVDAAGNLLLDRVAATASPD